jgi:alpha-D-xyloside xylohydrolase
MVLEYPDDPGCVYPDRQYMLGASLLVAPIFSDDGSVSYYLPQGAWTNFLTGTRVEGGSWQTEQHGYLSLPLMIPPNTVLCTGAEETRPDYDYARDVTVQVFELESGKTAHTSIPTAAGTVEAEVTVSREHSHFTVEKKGSSKPWKVLLRGMKRGKLLDGLAGETTEETPLGLLVSLKAGTERARIQV